MARIRSTARLATPTSSEALQREGNTSDAAQISTAPISEVMKASSSAKPKGSSKAAEELPKDRPSKPSYIEMGLYTLKDKDLQTMKKLGYFSSKVNVRLPGEEKTPNPKKDEVVVYRSFFKARLRLPMYQLIAKIL